MLIGAGLLARNAIAKGIGVKPWVKTSLAPGSQVVAEYLAASGLQKSLDKLGFNLVGFGCTTCIGNSGPLAPEISKTINDNGIIAAAVLSGNRNFEGRVSPDVQANYLASPPLVVAHALAGTVAIDLTSEPLGHDKKGHPVFLKDIWPSQEEISEIIDEYVTKKVFKSRYADVFNGDTHWRKVRAPSGETYKWDMGSTYVQNPPYFAGMKMAPEPVQDIENARILALFGDKITTDHISPAGSIKEASPAGQYLLERQVSKADFNQYGTRRGNHEIMMRGTFANIRIKNFILQKDNGLVPEGGLTKHWPDGSEMPIFEAAVAGHDLLADHLVGVQAVEGRYAALHAREVRLLGERQIAGFENRVQAVADLQLERSAAVGTLGCASRAAEVFFLGIAESGDLKDDLVIKGTALRQLSLDLCLEAVVEVASRSMSSREAAGAPEHALAQRGAALEQQRTGGVS